MEEPNRSKQNKPTPPTSPTTSEATEDSSAIPLPRPPQLIINEILTRLPVKYLLKFQRVAKSWLSSISSPPFVKAHLNASASLIDRHRFLTLRNGPLGYYFASCSVNSLLRNGNDAATNSDVITLNIPNLGGPFNSISIVGCLNGLICIDAEMNGLILWNPSTGKSKNLPDLTQNKRGKEFEYTVFGFGYDNIQDDYKVIGIICGINDGEGSVVTKVMVYSVKTECWRRIGDFQGVHPPSEFDHGTFAKGKLHWLWKEERKSICSLDLATETYGELEIPIIDEYDMSTLGVFEGNLCVLCDKEYERTDVWLLKEKGGPESWTKLLSILAPEPPAIRRLQKVFCSSEDGKILVLYGLTLGLFDPKDGSFWSQKADFFSAESLIYLESLISPTATASETTKDSTAIFIQSLPEPIIPLPSLPQSIFDEILTRLPVKHLLKFQRVAKSWLSLISSPLFVKAHLNASASSIDRRRFLTLSYGPLGDCFTSCSLNAFLRDGNDVIKAINSDVITSYIPNLERPCHISIVGCLNGLMCIDAGKSGLILWNPSTGKSKNLPHLIQNRRGKYKFRYSVFGFGYDDIHDDYKVIGIICGINAGEGSGLTEVMVYSIKTGCWRVGDFQGIHPPSEFDHGTFVNGKLHWVLSKEGHKSICSLDLATETYGEVETPNIDEYTTSTLGIFEGNLYMLCDKVSECTDVWLLKEYGVKESWIKLLTVPNFERVLQKVFCSSEDGKILVIYGLNLGLYDPKVGSFLNRRTDFLGPSFGQSVVYVESLTSPIANNDGSEGQATLRSLHSSR